MVQENIKIIRDFFRLVKGSKKWIFLLFFSSIITHLASLLIPVFVSNIIYQVTNGNEEATYINIALLALIYFIHNLFYYFNYYSYAQNFNYSYQHLREKIVDKIFTYDVDFSDKISKGTILNTVNKDCANLSEMIDSVCEIMVVFVKVVIILVIFLVTNFWIGFIVFILEVIYVKSYDYCNKKTTKYLKGQQKYVDKLTDHLSQILNGLGEIKVFNIYDKMKHNFFVISNKWSEQYLLKRKYINMRVTAVPLVIYYGQVLLYLILGYLVLKGYYSISTLVLLVTYFENIMRNSTELMGYSRQIREWSVAIVRIEALLNYSSKEQIDFGKNDTDQILGIVEFQDVSFSYKSKNKGNVTGVTFSILPNEITALVGHSGSGKTTITNLLLRKYKIDSGCILIDKENIYEYSNQVYSKNVVGVNQSPFIFNMSIRKNLSLIDSNFKRQIEACKRVGIHDYIMSLPKGYNTVLTENAVNFSGGQRQLLAIARTLLSKAEILIFDEVTSSLDTMLVEKMKGIFEDLKLDHTILIVTHKKDVMQIADKIVLFDHGKIVGEGTHEGLMKENKYYRDLQINHDSSLQTELGHTSFVELLDEEQKEGSREN